VLDLRYMVTYNFSARWNNLAEEFVTRFGRKPAYIARAPGRVKSDLSGLWSEQHC
jgi:hypothetical protein